MQGLPTGADNAAGYKNFQNFDEILLTEKAYNHVSTAQTGTLHPAPFEDDS